MLGFSHVMLFRARSTRLIFFALLVATAAWFATLYITSTPDTSASPPAASKNAAAKKDRPVPVRVVTLVPQDFIITAQALGTVTPERSALLTPQVGGQLQRIAFTEGQLVKAGELLAEIDPRPYQAALKQAEGELLRSEALLAEARANLARYETLLKQDSIARQQVDAQLSLVRQYEGAVKNNQGRVEEARVNLNFTRIVAPFSGRTGLRQVDEGNILRANDERGILVLTQQSPIGIVFSLPEMQLPLVNARMQETATPLIVEAWDRDNAQKLASGQIQAMDNQIDTRTGTFKLRAAFVNEPPQLFPNQFVNIRMEIARHTEALVIPAQAVRRQASDAFIFRIEQDESGKSIAKKKPITLGEIHGNMQRVLAGVTAGDKIVIEGMDSVKDASIVDISEDEKDSPGTSTQTPSHLP